LRWKCFYPADSCLILQETVYKGKIRSWGKTKKSLGKIHIPEQLAVDLSSWKKVCPDSSPEAFVFPGENGGFLDTDNYRKRVFKQLADVLNLPKLTFQVIRRTIATLSQTKGPVKSTQGLLRHARMPTTTDRYMQVIPEGVTEMVESVNGELRKPSSSRVQRATVPDRVTVSRGARRTSKT
jgi:integrase